MKPSDDWLDCKALDREFGERFGPQIPMRKLTRTKRVASTRWIQLEFWVGTPYMFSAYPMSL